MSCFFSKTNQYKMNKMLIKIRKETPKFNTESTENVFGGKKGKANENNKSVATITLII